MGTRRMTLILSLFPGGDLWGQATEQRFKDKGYPATIVRGPDPLFGTRIENFHAQPGMFDGIIGGPPCQSFSKARRGQEIGVNLIPEFLRVIEEAKPKWAVMENVLGARHEAPDWSHVRVRDWDVGGLTYRTRMFWFYGMPAPDPPSKRPGTPEYSVLASSWKNRSGKKGTHLTYPQRTVEEAATLQGFEDMPDIVFNALPMGAKGGITPKQRGIFIIHLLGNGVPRAMGSWIADHIIRCLFKA